MSEWKEYKLGEICDITSSKRIFYSEYVSDGVPFYRSKEIIDLHNRRAISTELYISEERYEEIKTKFGAPEIGDILLTSVGSLGIPYKVKVGDRFYFKDGNLTWVRNINQKVLSVDFLMHWIGSSIGIQKLDEVTIGSTQPALTISGLKTVDILLPTIEEQERIAGILSSLDDKIDLLTRQNRTLEAMAETLFRQYFNEKDNDDTIEQLICIQNGYAFKSQDFKEMGANGVVKIKNISGGVINIDTTDYIDSQIADAIHPKFRISSGDILIAMTGAEIGKLGIIPSTDKSLWLNQRVGLLAEKYKGAKYLAYLQLKSDFGQDYIENTATGSAQPNISGNGIEKCGFPKLSESDIIEYSYQIGELYDKVIFNLGQISTLIQLRNILLPKLMNREIIVNG